LAALASLLLWAFLLAVAAPSGWLHVPLAVGTTLLVRWIALRDDHRAHRSAPLAPGSGPG
jgi:hypothetical protein